MRRRLVLLQNRVGVDGRSNVLACIIRMLNEAQVDPTVATWATEEQRRQFLAANPGLELSWLHLKRPIWAQGDLAQQLALPWVARRPTAGTDVLFTHGTGVAGLPDGPAVFRYVTFPQERVPAIEDRYRRPDYRLYGRACTVGYRVARCLGGVRAGRWIANSQFTRRAAIAEYDLPAVAVDVVYPTAGVNVRTSSRVRKDPTLVASLSAFHWDKRQHEQLELARLMPDVHFVLAGAIRQRRYFERCRDHAARLQNVTLLPDASAEDIEDLLSRATVFLHTKRNEHFGIAIVEAMAHGCIPLVHNSGGPSEIVEGPDLRYDTVDDARRVLYSILRDEHPATPAWAEERVRSHYSGECFRRAIAPTLSEVIAEVRA